MELTLVRHRALLLLTMLAVGNAAAFATHFESQPSGATVYQVGRPEPLGTTPCDAEPQGHGLVSFRFEKSGFQPAVQRVYLPQKQIAATLQPAQTSFLVWVACGAGLGLVGLLLWGMWRGRTAHQVLQRAQTGTMQSDSVGTCVGPYLLTERLGSGGAGEVYRGHRQDGQDPIGQVAVKLVRVDALERERAEKRLSREVELLRRLKHPAIVHYLDMGYAGETLYLVEELLPGGNLADRIPPQGLSPAEFLTLFLPLLDGVMFAHSQGVIHRDLKPTNVLFTSDGRPRISDFGLARGEDSAALTTNNCMGTPLYMGPELFSGDPATPQSDQYALGVMAYEMLSGTLPFSGDSIMELVAQRIKPPKPISERLSHPLPGDMEQIVMRMLSYDPKDRFPSLSAVRELLEAVRV